MIGKMRGAFTVDGVEFVIDIRCERARSRPSPQPEEPPQSDADDLTTEDVLFRLVKEWYIWQEGLHRCRGDDPESQAGQDAMRELVRLGRAIIVDDRVGDLTVELVERQGGA